MALDFQTVSQIAASRALNTVFEGLVLAGFSWAALRCFGARSSMTRFAVWFATLLVIAGLPLLSLGNYASTSSSLHARGLTLSSAWAAGLFVAWAAIAGVLLLRLGFSLWHIRRLRRECKEVDGALYPSLTEVAGRLPHRPVRLLVSDEVRIPTALGFFRPAIVLPAWALNDLPADELKVILLHELAHLRRWDDWTNLAQKVLKALFFFHPAVWWIDSRLALEREIACDDLVLEQAPSARTYAASLVSLTEKVIAEKMRMRRALALAQSAIGGVREVSVRVARILDPRPRKNPQANHGWLRTFIMIGTLTVATVGAMPYAPDLVSFQQTRVPAFQADSRLSGSVSSLVVPAKWTAEAARVSPAVQRESRTVSNSSARPARVKAQGEVIPAKTIVRRTKRTPKIVLTEAPAQPGLAETLLLMRSTQLNGVGTPVWTLSVWRLTSPEGQIVQQMIVMNSI